MDSPTSNCIKHSFVHYLFIFIHALIKESAVQIASFLLCVEYEVLQRHELQLFNSTCCALWEDWKFSYEVQLADLSYRS